MLISNGLTGLDNQGGDWHSVNPTTGEVLGQVQPYPIVQVRDAVERARVAQSSWGSRSAHERAQVIRRLRNLVVENARLIARTDHEETGKPEIEAMGLILPVLDFCGYYAKLAETLERGRPAGSGLLIGRECQVEYRPAGVVAVISPWNFPFYLAMAQIVPALAAGNAVLHKPSEHAARVGLLIGELCNRAGVPEGVLQILVGGGEIGSAIVDAGVDVISFTGASSTGRKIMQAAAQHLTPVLLELGGKDVAIVCDDAEIERAANGINWGAFVNSGQACVAVKRAVVAKSVYPRFVECITERARELARMRQCLSPLILDGEIARMERQITEAVAKGARLVAGGRRLPGPGVFYEPSVLADCSPEMSAVSEETFGPLLTVLEASNDAVAVGLANDSEFGLSASVWTRDRQRGLEIARRLHTGSVAINDVMTPAADPRLPFGGVKRSGIGRAFSEAGYAQFCNVQSIVVARLTGRSDPHWYPYPRLANSLLERAIGICHSSVLEKIRRVIG
jgi:acyl-CoA reductase-like NAD-dependent aldehyde dehydrogenase